MRRLVAAFALAGLGGAAMAPADPPAPASAAPAAQTSAAPPAATAASAAPAAPAETPAAPPASPSSAATPGSGVPQVLVTTNKLDPDERRLIRAGYTLEMRDGEKVFCRWVDETGSRIDRHRECGTVKEIQTAQRENQSRLNQSLMHQVNGGLH